MPSLASAAFNNTAVGSNALSSNTQGNSNVATGYFALGDNTTGNRNVATGTPPSHETEATTTSPPDSRQ